MSLDVSTTGDMAAPLANPVVQAKLKAEAQVQARVAARCGLAAIKADKTVRELQTSLADALQGKLAADTDYEHQIEVLRAFMSLAKMARGSSNSDTAAVLGFEYNNQGGTPSDQEVAETRVIRVAFQ